MQKTITKTANNIKINTPKEKSPQEKSYLIQLHMKRR